MRIIKQIISVIGMVFSSGFLLIGLVALGEEPAAAGISIVTGLIFFIPSFLMFRNARKTQPVMPANVTPIKQPVASIKPKETIQTPAPIEVAAEESNITPAKTLETPDIDSVESDEQIADLPPVPEVEEAVIEIPVVEKPAYSEPHRRKTNYRKRTKLMDDYVVFDLETTGLKPSESEILEIGAIKYENNEEIDRFHSYVKPNRHISSRITRINGITDDIVKDAPSIDEALPAFLAFAGKETLVAHNAPFDMKFVVHYHGADLESYVSDTLTLSRRAFGFRFNKLTDWKERLGLDHLGSHNSIDDCIVCHELYQHVKSNSQRK
jgi:DNA polymerase-3 subunit epsilon